MAGNGPNCGLVYICPGKADAWLSIITYLCLLVCSLLYGFTGGLSSLDLINNAVCGLAPDSLALRLANNRPNKLIYI